MLNSKSLDTPLIHKQDHCESSEEEINGGGEVQIQKVKSQAQLKESIKGALGMQSVNAFKNIGKSKKSKQIKLDLESLGISRQDQLNGLVELDQSKTCELNRQIEVYLEKQKYEDVEYENQNVMKMTNKRIMTQESHEVLKKKQFDFKENRKEWRQDTSPLQLELECQPQLKDLKHQLKHANNFFMFDKQLEKLPDGSQKPLRKNKFETSVFEHDKKYFVVTQQTFAKLGFRGGGKDDRTEMKFSIFQLGKASEATQLVHEGTFFKEIFEEKDDENYVVAQKQAFMQVNEYIVFVQIIRNKTPGGNVAFQVNKFSMKTLELEEGEIFECKYKNTEIPLYSMFFSSVDNEEGIIDKKQECNYVTLQKSAKTLNMNEQFIMVCFWNDAVNQYQYEIRVLNQKHFGESLARLGNIGAFNYLRAGRRFFLVHQKEEKMLSILNKGKGDYIITKSIDSNNNQIILKDVEVRADNLDKKNDFVLASKIWTKPYLSFLSSDLLQIETMKTDINGVKTQVAHMIDEDTQMDVYQQEVDKLTKIVAFLTEEQHKNDNWKTLFGDNAHNGECNYDILIVNDPVNNKMIVLIRGYWDNSLGGHPLHKVIVLQTDLYGALYDVNQPVPVYFGSQIRNIPQNTKFTCRNMQNLSIQDLNDRVSYYFDDELDGKAIRRVIKLKTQHKVCNQIVNVFNRQLQPGLPMLKYGKHIIVNENGEEKTYVIINKGNIGDRLSQFQFVDSKSEEAKKQRLQRFSSIEHQLDEFDMKQKPIMVWDDNDKQQFLLLVDFTQSEPKVLEAILLGIKKGEFDQINRGSLFYSSDLYFAEVEGKTWICLNYNVAFESKNGHNRVIMIEFRIRWCQGDKTNEFNVTQMNVLARREIIYNKALDEKFYLYPVISNMWNEGNMIEGLKMDMVEMATGYQTIYQFDMPNQCIITNSCAQRFDNMITTSYYKRYRKHYSSILKGHHFVKDHERFSALVIEARLNNVNDLKSQGYKPTELFQLLRGSTAALMNMKVASINDFIYLKEYDIFQSSEVLQGYCHGDFLIDEPGKIKQYLDTRYTQYQARSLIKQFTQQERTLESPLPELEECCQQSSSYMNRKKCRHLQTSASFKYYTDMGILFMKEMMSYDLMFTTVLYRCITQESPQMQSADILIESLQKWENKKAQSQLMAVLPYFLRSEQKSKQLLMFMGQTIEQNPDEPYDWSKFKHTMSFKIESEGLPNYSDNELYAVTHNIRQEAAFEDQLTNFVTKKISADLQCGQGSKNEIEHHYLDFRALLFDLKIRNTQEQDPSIKVEKVIIDKKFVAEIAYKMVLKLKSNIGDYRIVQTIVDWQFDVSVSYFKKQLAIYIITFVLPFIIQVYLTSYVGVLVCLGVSCVSCIYFLRNELMQLMEDGPTEYLADIYNWIDLSSAVFFIVFSSLRIYNLEAMPNIMIDDESLTWEDNKNTSAILRILILMITLQMMVCIFFYLRVIGEYGKLIMLIAQCLQDVQTFMRFFCLWISFFAFANCILGIKQPHTGYTGLRFLFRVIFNTWRISIGDIITPDGSIWLGDDGVKTSHGSVMLVLIWLYWLINQFIVLIILLNFLIAIISQSYEQILSRGQEITYADQSTMNKECTQILKEGDPIDCITFSITKGGSDSEEWGGLIDGVKTFVLAQNKIIQKVNTLKADKFIEKLDEYNDDVASKRKDTKLQIDTGLFCQKLQLKKTNKRVKDLEKEIDNCNQSLKNKLDENMDHLKDLIRAQIDSTNAISQILKQ